MNRSPRLGNVVIATWLVVMWVLLWGDFTPANVVTGAAVAIALVAVFPPAAVNDDPIVVRPLATASFLLWFVRALIITNVVVAREVLLPSSRSEIRTAVVSVQLRTQSGRLATIVANTITLTPGTLTIDARGRPAMLFVHVLSFESVEATRAEVADLERRIVDAFGTREEAARVAGVPPDASNPDGVVPIGDEEEGAAP